MAFEIYVTRGPRAQLPLGKACLGKTCTLRLTIGDLAKAGLGKQAVVLCDTATRRIALRTPREGREFAEPTLQVKWAKRANGGRVNLRGPLRQLGLEPPPAATVYDVLHKDGLLIVNLGAAGEGPRGRGTEGSAKGKGAREA